MKMDFHHLHTVNFNNNKVHKYVGGVVNHIPTLRPKLSVKRVAPKIIRNDVKPYNNVRYKTGQDIFNDVTNKNYNTREAPKKSASKTLNKRYKACNINIPFFSPNDHYLSNHATDHLETNRLMNSKVGKCITIPKRNECGKSNNDIKIMSKISRKPKSNMSVMRPRKKIVRTFDYSLDNIRSPCSILSLQRNTYPLNSSNSKAKWDKLHYSPFYLSKSRKNINSRTRLCHITIGTNTRFCCRKTESDITIISNSKDRLMERYKIRKTRKSKIKTYSSCNPCLKNPCFSKVCQVPSLMKNNNPRRISSLKDCRSRCVFCGRIKPCLLWFYGRIKTIIKYSLFIMTVIIWLPCIITIVMCWVMTYPLRPNFNENVFRSSDCNSRKGKISYFIINTIATLCNPVLIAFDDVYSILEIEKQLKPLESPIRISGVVSCNTCNPACARKSRNKVNGRSCLDKKIIGEDACFSVWKRKSDTTVISNSKARLIAHCKICTTRSKVKARYNCNPYLKASCFSKECQVPSVMLKYNNKPCVGVSSVRGYKNRCVLCSRIKPSLKWFCDRIKTVVKYGLFILILLVWLPCIIAVVLCWLITYPLCPIKEIPDNTSDHKCTNVKLSYLLIKNIANLCNPVLNAFSDVYTILETRKRIQTLLICQPENPSSALLCLKCFRHENDTPALKKTFSSIYKNRRQITKPTVRVDEGNNRSNRIFHTDAIQGFKNNCVAKKRNNYCGRKLSNNKKSLSYFYHRHKHSEYTGIKSIASEKHFVISDNKSHRIRNMKLFLDCMKQHDSSANQRKRVPIRKLSSNILTSFELADYKKRRNKIDHQTSLAYNASLKTSSSMFIDKLKSQYALPLCTSCDTPEVYNHSLCPPSQLNGPLLPLSNSNMPKRQIFKKRLLQDKLLWLCKQLQYWLQYHAHCIKSEIINTDKSMWAEDVSCYKPRMWPLQNCLLWILKFFRNCFLILCFCIWCPILLLLYLCWIICCQFL